MLHTKKELAESIIALLSSVTPLDELLGYTRQHDENEKRQLNAALFFVVQESFELQREWFEQLQEERRKVGLENTSPLQIAVMRKGLETNLDEVNTVEDVNQTVVNWAKLVAVSDSLWQDVLSKKSDDLFNEEIGSG